MHIASFIISILVWSISGALIGKPAYNLHKKGPKKLRKKLMIIGASVGIVSGTFAAFINGTYNLSVLIQDSIFALIITYISVIPTKRYKKQFKKIYKKNKALKFSFDYLLGK